MVSNKKQEPRISGTCIRTLVKQLASSRTKDSSNNNNNAMTPQHKPAENSAKSGDGSGKSGKKQTQTQTQTQTHKKQVRRRLHTSRPYQERLLNMAEARREIVTALKQHRAAMRQASEQRQRQQTQTQTQTLLLREQGSRPNAMMMGATDYVRDPFTSCVRPPPPPQPPDPFSWRIPTNPPLNFVLPNQPLGLNLNFQDFSDIIQASPSSSSSPSISNTNNNNPPLYSSPSSSSSPTPPSSAVSAAASATGDAAFHQTADQDEMARMRSIGDKHQMEWDDTVNLVTSAWWLEFMKKTVEQPPEMRSEIDGDVFRPFDDVMEFPSWLNPTEDFDFFQPYLSDYSSPDDPALSCLEIGEIEGMDGDWLA